ncbi:hypothetical protein WJX84_009647 [Apatococcus fuscideae]|uniref:LITAF domain-containing protein n=1 Tax=Apatococcus fuscideae TaxID=2026836 RepID=A0AAW1SQS5_9CHLO
MGVPVPQDGSSSAAHPIGYPQNVEHPLGSPQYPPAPQYPPPQYPQQYDAPNQQAMHSNSQTYVQQQAYAQEPPAAKAQPQYAQPAAPVVGVPTGPTYASTLRPQPIPGMATRGPLKSPGPGDVLLGYEVSQPETGCCKTEGLSALGWIAVILLFFIFFPVMCVPCCMPECYEQYQRPVYGRPT